MPCQDFASRANAYATRDQSDKEWCDTHERWHWTEECPECRFEDEQERHERALVVGGQA